MSPRLRFSIARVTDALGSTRVDYESARFRTDQSTNTVFDIHASTRPQIGRTAVSVLSSPCNRPLIMASRRAPGELTPPVSAREVHVASGEDPDFPGFLSRDGNERLRLPSPGLLLCWWLLRSLHITYHMRCESCLQYSYFTK